MGRSSKKMTPESKEQIDRFKEAARELGCDEDEARFDEKLGKLVKHRPKKPEKPEKESGD